MNFKNKAYVLLSVLTIDSIYGMEQKNNAICEAAKAGNLVLIQELVAAGTDVDTRNHNGTTVIHIAAGEGHKEVVEWLIANKADINTQGSKGSTALHWAAFKNQSEIIKLLLAHRADISAVNNDGNAALHIASYCGSIDAARVLLEAGANVDLQGQEGRTALHCASIKNCPEMIKLLLAHRADINAVNNLGDKALHLASLNGSLDAARVLLEAGANVDLQGQSRYTALHWAAQKNQSEMIKLLLTHRADINAIDNGGNTALHIASLNRSIDAARALIEAGADLDMLNPQGMTALHCSNLSIVQMLIHAGATIDADSLTLLNQAQNIQKRVKSAISNNDIGQLRELLLKNQTYMSGDIILFLSKKYRELLEAVKLEKVDKVKELYEKGLPLTIRWKDGNTLLHVAARANQPAMVDYLLRQGMDVSATNDSGQTVVHIAVDKHVNPKGQKSVLAVIAEFASGVAWNPTATPGKRIRDAVC